MTKRRTRGQLRPLTDADRARKAARNMRRDRAPGRPVEPGAQLTRAARPTIDRQLAGDHRAVRSFLGRRLQPAARADRRRARQQSAAIAEAAKAIATPTRRAA